MMEAPKRIITHKYSNSTTSTDYIRADLVEKLIEHCKHPSPCLKWNATTYYSLTDDTVKPLPCTCGLDDLIREVRNGQ